MKMTEDQLAIIKNKIWRIVEIFRGPSRLPLSPDLDALLCVVFTATIAEVKELLEGEVKMPTMIERLKFLYDKVDYEIIPEAGVPTVARYLRTTIKEILQDLIELAQVRDKTEGGAKSTPTSLEGTPPPVS